jgi:hypothetical protein
MSTTLTQSKFYLPLERLISTTNTLSGSTNTDISSRSGNGKKASAQLRKNASLILLVEEPVQDKIQPSHIKVGPLTPTSSSALRKRKTPRAVFSQEKMLGAHHFPHQMPYPATACKWSLILRQHCTDYIFRAFMNWNLPYQTLLQHLPHSMNHHSPYADAGSTPSDVSYTSPPAIEAASSKVVRAAALKSTQQTTDLFINGNFDGLLRALSAKEKKYAPCRSLRFELMISIESFLHGCMSFGTSALSVQNIGVAAPDTGLLVSSGKTSSPSTPQVFLRQLHHQTRIHQDNSHTYRDRQR